MNKIIQCPYCKVSTLSKTNIKFKTWSQVVRHVNHCKSNNGEYYVSNIGFYHFNDLNNLTAAEISIKYPELIGKITRIKYSFKIRGKEINIIGVWDKTLILAKLIEFYKQYNRTPIMKDFDLNNKYPDSTTVIRHFGSWNKALVEAELPINIIDQYGIQTLGKDGIVYRSKAEALFSDTYLYKKYTYEYEKSYGNGWFYDFYIKELDLYIEIDGGLRPQRIQEKIEFNKKINRKLLIIPIATIGTFDSVMSL